MITLTQLCTHSERVNPQLLQLKQVIQGSAAQLNLLTEQPNSHYDTHQAALP